MRTAHDLTQLLDDFCEVARLARLRIARSDISGEFQPAPHNRPRSLPTGRQAVYGFVLSGCCLKVGKAGPKTAARYTSQHYLPNSCNSNLSKSLLSGRDRLRGLVAADVCDALVCLDEQSVGPWVERQCARFNVLIALKYEEYELSLLEAFIQCRMRPVFEGRHRARWVPV